MAIGSSETPWGSMLRLSASGVPLAQDGDLT
jgi:hypothetical protein